MKRKHIHVGRGYQISEDIKKTIINECDNPADYEQYVELNLLAIPTREQLTITLQQIILNFTVRRHYAKYNRDD